MKTINTVFFALLFCTSVQSTVMKTNLTYGAAALCAIGGLRSTYLFASSRQMRLAVGHMISPNNRGLSPWFPPEMKRLAVRAACFRLTTAAALFMSAYLLYLWAQRTNEIISLAPVITLSPASEVPLIVPLSMEDELHVQTIVEDVVGDSCATVVAGEIFQLSDTVQALPHVQTIAEDVIGDSCVAVTAEEIFQLSDTVQALPLVVEEDPVPIVAEQEGEAAPVPEVPEIGSIAATNIPDEECVIDDNSAVSSEPGTIFSYWWDCKEGEEPFDNLEIWR